MKRALSTVLCILMFINANARLVYDATSFGIIPNADLDASPLVEQMLNKVKAESAGKPVTIRFAAGKYHFHANEAAQREYYISNHDQYSNRAVGIAIEHIEGLTIDGQGADFIFHGRMLPVSIVGSKDCTLRNFSVDFATPHIAQAEIIANDTERGITFRTAPWVNAVTTPEGAFAHTGEGWTCHPRWGIAFEGDTRHIVFNTSDIGTPVHQVTRIDECTFTAPAWKDQRLKPGTIVAMRTYDRPSPGIFISHAMNTKLENIKVHYAEGMGLLAQMSEDITLDGFSVCLRGDNDPRYFTTQADATHFSGCKGKITSVNGLYEGMMDDAINVHGTYLKVMERIDDYTLRARYMHGQAWGFDWGYAGDKVQFVRSHTMEIVGDNKVFTTKVADIHIADKPAQSIKNSQGYSHGAREFIIRFADVLPTEINGESGYGIENLTWTPEVYFAHNTIRNNRARGTLFSTPRRTVVEENLFDHTSGTAILLCGDCNGWYETGACRDVLIRRNRFVNALTNMFQFTNGVISIYPEIPALNEQKAYFHGGKKNAIRIVNNEFDTFDFPLLYAKSVDGLLFKGNTIRKNTDYPSFHWNKSNILLERVTNVNIENTLLDKGNEIKQMRLMLPED